MSGCNVPLTYLIELKLRSVKSQSCQCDGAHEDTFFYIEYCVQWNFGKYFQQTTHYIGVALFCGFA